MPSPMPSDDPSNPTPKPDLKPNPKPEPTPSASADGAPQPCGLARRIANGIIPVVSISLLIWAIAIWSVRLLASVAPSIATADLWLVTGALWLIDVSASVVTAPLLLAFPVAMIAVWHSRPGPRGGSSRPESPSESQPESQPDRGGRLNSMTAAAACGAIVLLLAFPLSPSRAAHESAGSPVSRVAGNSDGALRSEPQSEPASAPILRVAVFNAAGAEPDPDLVARAMLRIDADVIALLEPPVMFQRALREGRVPELTAAYPHRLVRGWVEGQLNPAYLLARFPIQPVIEPVVPPADPQTAPALTQTVPVDAQLLSGLLMRPESQGGPVYILTTHPSSPRSPGRWLQGNQIAAAAVQRLKDARAARPSLTETPVVFLADLNAGPGTVRDRMWARAGLRRTKARTQLGGTYTPAALPLPYLLGVAIDDAFVSEHWVVRSWQTHDTGLSDHLAVSADLALRDGGRQSTPDRPNASH